MRECNRTETSPRLAFMAASRLSPASDKGLILPEPRFRQRHYAKRGPDFPELRRSCTPRLRFASMVKNPFGQPLGYVDDIADMGAHGPPSNKQQRQLEAVQRNGDRMDALVNDIMAMAKIKSGTLELSPKELDLARELEGVLGYLQGQLDEKRITVNLVAPVTMTWVRADELRLSQIMVNLLGNACKYSSSDSSITLEVRAGERFAQIDVTDTGCGISQYDQGNRFCQFHRAKTAICSGRLGNRVGLVRGQAVGGSPRREDLGPGEDR